MKRLLFPIILLLTITHTTIAQDIQRRSFLGIQMENVTIDVMRVMELKDSNGVLINHVVPGSTAEAAGFKTGDILLNINGQTINSPQEGVEYVGKQKSNTPFTYELIRSGKTVKGKSSFKPYPTESYKDLDVIYTQAKTPSGLQRVIITKQKNKTTQPVVVFIGGIGCYSLDMPMDSSRSEIQLLNKLSREGYTTVRIEKSGMGDGAGYGKPCNEIGFNEEAEGYIAAIKQLQEQQNIVNDKLYIIGHSMGGVMAPLIAARTKVDGIVAYGTIGSNFMEYLAKTRRTIGEAYQWESDETDAYIKDFCECAAYYFINKMTTAEASRKNAECREYLPVFDLRSRKYNDELYSLNIPAAWKPYDGKALLLWGESDYIASKEDHEIITSTINHYHKGNAEFMSVQQTNHGMNVSPSPQEEVKNPGTNYNTQIGDIISNWLRRQS
jgi:pimeloyl-ACP methyl ester carboxylesterase